MSTMRRVVVALVVASLCGCASVTGTIVGKGWQVGGYKYTPTVFDGLRRVPSPALWWVVVQRPDGTQRTILVTEDEYHEHTLGDKWPSRSGRGGQR